MTRERWGTFSVKDHTFGKPFAADVLMYDRLVIPKPADEPERKHWVKEKWDPDQLDRILDILRADKPDGLAVTVRWGSDTRDLFNRRAETAKVVNEEQNLGLTRRLLTKELRPPAPPGVAPVAVLAAYPSAGVAEGDWAENSPQGKRETLTLALSYRFLCMDPRGRTDLQLLKDAVALGVDPTYRAKRARMYDWMEDVIRNGLSKEDALHEMAQYLVEYDKAVDAAGAAVYSKFAFTLIPIALSELGGQAGALARVGAIANLLRFWIFDRKPVVQAGDSAPAAMFHDPLGDLTWRRAALPP